MNEEFLVKLQKAVEESGAGVELWFGHTDWDLSKGKMTFKEWVEGILEAYT